MTLKEAIESGIYERDKEILRLNIIINELNWKPIKEYDESNYDWVLVKYFDGNYECVPIVAEKRFGKWYSSEGKEIKFKIKYFFDMQQLDKLQEQKGCGDMNLYTAKEIFNMLYDNKISQEDCIEVVHPEEENHYLLRRGWSNDFNKDDLFGCLLFKEYKFRIVNQKEAEIKISKKQKGKRIKELERELEKLKRNEE